MQFASFACGPKCQFVAHRPDRCPDVTLGDSIALHDLNHNRIRQKFADRINDA
jgi:hypothetical protein